MIPEARILEWRPRTSVEAFSVAEHGLLFLPHSWGKKEQWLCSPRRPRQREGRIWNLVSHLWPWTCTTAQRQITEIRGARVTPGGVTCHSTR